eukprot:TRINITY_DN26335_c0_g1_i1.p2 TRINITY_DN26335_c0_g1~~TRINITY_DN26335_c0_g1_i1.p2  ORF type:complete len:137 (-),score=43.63 TRINITY_DN26335_c0_g1_i1:32-403(-)
MTKTRAYELRQMNKQDLLKKLQQYKKELAENRVAKVTGGTQTMGSKIHLLRKDIARILTCINHNALNNLREYNIGKKYQPKKLRAKKTRAIRRQLSLHEATRKTLKQRKKEKHFPQRKFAVKM